MNLDWSNMPIHQSFKSDWSTPEILLEGSLGCAKSTAGLDKETDALLKWPGIPILLSRWTEESVSTKLQTAFEEILNIRNLDADWDSKAKLYRFPNGSIAHMFGLKAASEIELFSKLRSLGVSRIFVDQAEEVRRAVAEELRARLRPDLTATMKGIKYPFQLTFVANPSDDSFWLSREFPTDNHIKGRKLYSLSVFDNPHLPQETVDGLLRTFPEEHPKHQTMVLGKRGLNISGEAIYDQLYVRALHARPLTIRANAPLLEAFHCGTHNPAWVVAQRTYHGGLMLLGGIMGRGLTLEDFLPLVGRCREEWFPDAEVLTTTGPLGETYQTARDRYTLMSVLRQWGVTPRWREYANAPDVQLAMIEIIGGLMRRRTAGREEAFGIESTPGKWFEASLDGVRLKPFLSFGFEGGYVWSDHTVSVSNATVRQPRNDDWYFNGMRCVENIVLNFCASSPTESDRDQEDNDSETVAVPTKRVSVWS